MEDIWLYTNGFYCNGLIFYRVSIYNNSNENYIDSIINFNNYYYSNININKDYIFYGYDDSIEYYVYDNKHNLWKKANIFDLEEFSTPEELIISSLKERLS